MNIQEAKNLSGGTWIYSVTMTQGGGKIPLQARITSVKTWKRTPERVEVRCVHGLRNFFSFNEHYLENWTTDREEAQKILFGENSAS